MNNKTKKVAVGCVTVCGLVICITLIVIFKMQNKNKEQIDTTTSKSRITTAATTTVEEEPTGTTEDDTTIKPDEPEEKPSEQVTVVTTLPDTVVPESEVVYTTEPKKEDTVPEPTNETTETTIESKEVPTTTEIDPNNVEGVTNLSRDEVETYILSNFDLSDGYTLQRGENGAFYFNGKVVVFTNNKPIGSSIETSLGEGIVVSQWYGIGYVIVMEQIDG